MALPDPLLLDVSLFTNQLASSWPKLSDGEYILSSTDSDTPQIITINRTLDPSKFSSYVLKTTQAKNVAPSSSGAYVPDDVLQVHTVVRVPHRSFAQADALRLLDLNTTAFLQYFPRIFRGER